MSIKKYFYTIVVAVLMMLIATKSTSASTGVVQLVSTSAQTNRCVLTSLQLPNSQYRVVLNCRDLIYPVDGNFFSYVLWITPSDGSKPVKLGTIDLGRKEYVAKTSFTNAYITTEESTKVKTPSTKVVMKGVLEPFTLLQGPPTEEEKVAILEATPTEGPVPTPKESSTNRLVTGLKRAGIAFGLALAIGIVVVFIVTRSKR